MTSPAEIQLDFLDPGGTERKGAGGATFPTGHRVDTLDVPDVGCLQATLINAGTPTICIGAGNPDFAGIELQEAVNGDAAPGEMRGDSGLSRDCDGPAASADGATEKRPATSKLAFAVAPKNSTASSGKQAARILSMCKPHHAMTGTGAVALAAAAIPDTVVHRVMVVRASAE
jgi:hypothetical protein